MEGALINRCKQSRKVKPSARPGQLDRIREADSGHTGDVFSAGRCFVRKRNTTPGYRGSREAGRMDCHREVQHGHRVLYGDRCGGSGHSLMSLMVCVFLAMVLLLPVCSGANPCQVTHTVDDEWRDLSSQGGQTDHCDKQFLPDHWYTFRLRGKPAWIPTQCVKSNMCGARVGMRVDLLGQSLPSKGNNITAALCGAYDVLGKYDCCVLRTTVYIARCSLDDLGEALVYSFPTRIDRCPVAVCTQGEITVPPAAFAKMGEDVNKPDDSTTVTDIPDTTPDVDDATTAVITTVEEIASDTTSEPEQSTESPAPPQPLMQQTTVSETATSDVAEELSTEVVTTPETTSSASPTDTSSHVDVESQGTDASTTDLPQVSDSVTESGTESETSSMLVSEIHTSTNPSSDLPDETTEATTAATSADETSTEAESTDTAKPTYASQETTSDNTPDVSSDVNLISATDISTTEQPMASVTEVQTTAQSITDEELSSTIQSLGDEDSRSSNDSGDEATTSASLDLSTTTSAVSSSSVIYEPVSQSAEEEDTSSTPTFTATNTTITDPTASTPITTESTLETIETRRESTTWTQPLPPSSTTIEGIEVTTIKLPDNGDVIMDEHLRFVFQGMPQDVAPVAKVQDLLDKFLKRAKGDSDWSYTLSSEAKAINYQNTSTYMDFRIVRRGNDVKEGNTFFEEHQLTEFVSKNWNMTLIAVCRTSKHCEEESFFPFVLASVFEKNAPAFTAVIVLCAICLLILILVVLYSRFSKRGSWKAPDPEPNKLPENRRHYNGNQSPFTDEQIMKDEMVDNASASYNGSAKDGDTNLSGTWVIPLDQDTANQQTTSVSITTEDTQF